MSDKNEKCDCLEKICDALEQALGNGYVENCPRDESELNNVLLRLCRILKRQ